MAMDEPSEKVASERYVAQRANCEYWRSTMHGMKEEREHSSDAALAAATSVET